MAGDFKHIDVGPSLSRVEFESPTTHHFAAQAIGDIPYASSAAQLEGLTIGGTGAIMTVAAGIPSWLAIGATGQVFTVAAGAAVWSDTIAPLGDLTLAPGGELVLNLSAGQNYSLENINTQALAIQGKSSGVFVGIDFFTQDGDGTDDNNYTLYGVGTPDSLANTERINIAYVAASTAFQIDVQATGTGVARNLTIENDGTPWLTFTDAAGVTHRAGTTFQSDGAAEIGIAVSNGALVIGTSGSIVMPYLRAAVAIGTDALFGDLNGAMAVLSDSGGVDTIETRVEGAWVSVAVAGYIINDNVSMLQGGWTHWRQHREDGRLDETICIQCGEQMQPHDQITMWANKVVPYSKEERSGEKLHAAFGHLHPEEDPYISRLEERVRELEGALKIAA